MTRTLSRKLLPPRLPAAHLHRPSLERQLAEARDRRLALVVAGAGFGKSTLLAAWTSSLRCAWYTADAHDAHLTRFARGLVDALALAGLSPDLTAAVEGSLGPGSETPARAQALAGLLCAAIEHECDSDLVLVVDDVHELGEASASVWLLESLVRQAPPALRLVVASRAEPAFPLQRLRGRGDVLDLGPQDLAFSVEEVSALLEWQLGGAGGELGAQLHERTHGWPVAVRLALETLRSTAPDEREHAFEALRAPAGPLFAYLAEEVITQEPPEVRDLLRVVAPLQRFNLDLCAALGLAVSQELLAGVLRRGVFLEPRTRSGGWFALTGLMRQFVQEHLPLPPAARRKVYRTAAERFEAAGDLEDALFCLSEAGDADALARFLIARGPQLLAAGAVQHVAEAAQRLLSASADPAVRQLLGEALHVLGDWEAALACFRGLASGAGPLPAALAWRLGVIHHLRGDLAGALGVYARGDVDGASDADAALLSAWTATAHWLLGDAAACAQAADAAHAAATRSGEMRAIAAAHTALALLAALEGDRQANEAHYERAFDAARDGGDVLQMVRIRSNRASRLMEEGAYGEALAELDLAIPLAEATGFTVFLALSLNNRGELRRRLGQLEEATADLEAARALYARMDSRSVAYPLCNLGDVHRTRGDLAMARACYEEALAHGEHSGDQQALLPALAGLARVIAREEPERAVALADRAVEYGPGMAEVQALLAAGWVALAAGERERARTFGDRAAAAARTRRDRAGLAEALELTAMAAPASAHGKLEEARALWRELGDVVAEAAVDLALALRTNGSGEHAQQRLRELGVRAQAGGAAGLLAALGEGEPSPLVIHTLGGLRVLREGVQVEAAEWQSKKARELLKRLVARRGRALHREQLMEGLWPDEDVTRLGNRLSVALSTVRSVLDPQRRFEADYFVRADKDTVCLDLDHVSVDVEQFLQAAQRGWTLQRHGQVVEAVAAWQAAEAAYAGDFLEEDAYEDWAVPLREEARATYIALTRALGEAADDVGDVDGAVRYRLRIIERDTYDEEAHMSLVTVLLNAGRHGESRRAYGRYVASMQDLGVEPAPFPAA